MLRALTVSLFVACDVVSCGGLYGHAQVLPRVQDPLNFQQDWGSAVAEHAGQTEGFSWILPRLAPLAAWRCLKQYPADT